MPILLRAVTSNPSGHFRSIFRMGGVVRSLPRASLSSMVAGDWFSFQLSFCVSGASLMSTFSFSRSLMLKTPWTIPLLLRCLVGFASDGEAGASSTAESTLLKGAVGSCTSAAIVVMTISYKLGRVADGWFDIDDDGR